MMPRSHFASFLGLLVFCGSLTGNAADRPRRSGEAKEQKVVPGILIVKLTADAIVGTRTPTASVGQGLRRAGLAALEPVFPSASLAKQPADPIGVRRIYYAHMGETVDPVHCAAMLRGMPGVEYAEPKYLQTVADVPNDPVFTASQSEYFSQMHVQDGWSMQKTNGGVIVADVDGGTYWQHEDLAGNVWINSAEDINHNGKFDQGPPPLGDEDGIDNDGDGFADDVIGWNFANKTNNPAGLTSTPRNASHGTATASHFGAVTNNATGIAGTAWNCKLMPINASSGSADDDISFGYEGIYFAATHGAKVINCSWGRLGTYSQFEHDVVKAASVAGALVVAAAGNYSNNNDYKGHYPASFEEVLAVGATNNASDVVAGFSDFGISVQVFAPGVDIVGAFNGGGYGIVGSGTSFSSPLVAGLASLVFAQHPLWTPQQVMAQIRVTSDPIDIVNAAKYQGRLGHGRVNFARALSETHPGLVVSNERLFTIPSKQFYVQGDTLRLSVSVQNVLGSTASALQFHVTTSDPSLGVVAGTASPGSLAPGASMTLPDFLLRVDTVSNAKEIVIKVQWVSNQNDTDAAALNVTVFHSPPRWTLEETPSASGLFCVKAVSASIVWASGGDGVAGAPSVVRSRNGGTSWVDATGNLQGADFYCMTAVDSLHAWVGSSAGQIYATSDGGISWTLQLYPGRQSHFIDAVEFFDASEGVVLGDPPGAGDNTFVMLTTTNGGRTWSHMASEPVGGSAEAGWANSMSWIDRNHGWFGTNNSVIWRTTDGGSTWSHTATGSQKSLGVSFGDLDHGIAVFEDGLIQFSTDGGRSWAGSAKPSPSMVAVSFVPRTMKAWAVDDATPYVSSDGGATWTQENAVLFLGSLSHLSAADTGRAWIATSFGEVLSYGSDTNKSVAPPGTPLPLAISLEQNYPNPFNATTTISYELPQSSEVSITVYNVLGQKIRVVESGMRAEGRHSVSFDGSALPSGVYMYRLRSGGSRMVRKMLLLR